MEIKKTFEHPHITSWCDELSTNIKNKEKKLTGITTSMQILKDTNDSKEKEILSLEKTMNIILDNIEKYIGQYSKKVTDKLNDVKVMGHGDQQHRSVKIFSLYKELFKDACTFFSRREFNTEASELKVGKDNKFKSYISQIFDDESDNIWTEVLSPIWSLEEQYIDMEIEYKELRKIYQNGVNIFDEQKKVYDKINNEIISIKTQLNIIQEFSSKIKNIKNM